MALLQFCKVISQRRNHRHYLPGQYQLRESNFLYWCSIIHLFLPTYSYCNLLHFNVNVWQRYWRFLRVPVSQNECFMRVKLSVFVVYWVMLLHHHVPHVYNQHKTSLQNGKILAMFLLCYRKIYWLTWN